MTTTKLIALLQKIEYGASGRSREISFTIGDLYISDAEVQLISTGDGCCGAEVDLEIIKNKSITKKFYDNRGSYMNFEELEISFIKKRYSEMKNQGLIY
jgi:hypothetical protein